MVKDFLKRQGWFRKPLLYIYHKCKNRHLVKFWYSSSMSANCRFEGKNMVCRGTSFSGSLGYGSYLGRNCLLNAEIGRFTSIAPGCRYLIETHPMRYPYVTTSPFFYSLDKGKSPDNETFAKEQYFDEYLSVDKKEVFNVIGSDCWIGTNVTLVGGVEIGDGAVVLAHAVVTKNIPPYAIAGGVPAKIIGYRYDEETIGILLKSRWWENDVDWFRKHSDLLVSMDKFVKYIKQNRDAD